MTTLYAKWIDQWEYKLATADTNRVVRPFDWGADWLLDAPASADVREKLLHYVEDAVRDRKSVV